MQTQIQPPQETYQEVYPETNIRSYWEVLLRRRHIVIFFAIICVAAVTAASFLMTPLFKATTSMMVEGEDSSVGEVNGSSNKGVSFDIFENYLETQMALIRSRSVAGKVFELYNLGSMKPYSDKEDPLKAFVQDIELERLKGTRVIKISVYNPSPQLAADLANKLSEVYARDNLKRRAMSFIRAQRMAALNSEFLRLQSKLDQLSNQYGPKHPAMIALRQEIRTMSDRIEKERLGRDEDPDNIKSAAEQQLLEDTLLRMQEGTVFSSSRMNNIVITDKAVPPKRHAKPKKLTNIVIGLMAGLIGGIFLAFFVDYLDDTIKTDEDLKKYIGSASFLGSIPLHKETWRDRSAGLSTIDCVVALYPNSASAEAYRLARTGILWFVRREQNMKDIALLSAASGEGKSTTASNLAIALSQVMGKVLVVDADIRRGRLHKSFGMAIGDGLGQYLTEDAAFESVVKPTKIHNVSLVTCGRSVINSSQLLSSERMQEFITESRRHFDMVIYDTPPITLISDAAILLSQIGGAILVTRSGVTGYRKLPKAINLIRGSSAKFIGVILNGTAMQDSKYYSHYYSKK